MGTDIGIDLGTATTLIYMKDKGIVLREPSVVAADADTNEVLAVGQDAYNMLGRTPKRIRAVYPLSEGVISDFKLTEQMITQFLNKVCRHKIFMPRVIVCMPSSVTGVERRTLIDTLISSGARKVSTIEEPIAAALGAGVDIAAPHGSMIIDIGGGTTDIAVLSLNGVAVTQSIRIAGNNFDVAIVKYLRRTRSIIIGEKMAEKLKTQAGAALALPTELTANAKGRHGITGLPCAMTVTSTELLEAVSEQLDALRIAIQGVLESTPPELLGDIYNDGIILTGGGSMLKGFDQFIKQNTGIECRYPEDPVECVALGLGASVKYIDVLEGEHHRYLTPDDLILG